MTTNGGREVRERTDAVVVGSGGLGDARALLGSTSDGTVRYSPVPVLVVL